MVKGFSYMIEIVITIFIFMIFSVSIISSYFNEPYDGMLARRKMMHIYEFLDMKGKLRETACLNKSTELENEIEKYSSYGFDVSFCNNECTTYLTPPWKHIYVYNRVLYGCYGYNPRIIRTFMWVK